MNDPLKTLPPETYEASPNVTFSPGLEDGPTRCDLLDGPTTDQSGPEVVLANLSATQAKEMGLLTSGTYGRPGSISSASADLTQSLVNKLKPRLAKDGSTLFKMTWKESATPSGRCLFQLAASVPRTSVREFTSWPTPNSGPQNDTDMNWQNRRVECKERHGNNGFGMTLGMASTLATWATPTTRDHKDGDCSEQILNGSVEIDSLLGRQDLTASWPTPMAGSPATETYNEADNTAGRWYASKNQTDLADQAIQAVSGETLTGSTAPIKSIGQLNPAHSRWLMGLPTVWDDCGVMVTRLLHRKRKHS
jgi:hypothetical protein